MIKSYASQLLKIQNATCQALKQLDGGPRVLHVDIAMWSWGGSDCLHDYRLYTELFEAVGTGPIRNPGWEHWLSEVSLYAYLHNLSRSLSSATGQLVLLLREAFMICSEHQLCRNAQISCWPSCTLVPAALRGEVCLKRRVCTL